MEVGNKHTLHFQDLQEISIPDVVQEDLAAASTSSFEQRRASADSLETLRKQRLEEEERCKARRRMELEEQRLRQEEEERRRRAAEELRLRELEEQKERKQREEAERRQREDEERRRREEEERRQREEEERRRRREEEEEQQRRKREEEARKKLEEQRQREEEERRKREEEEEERVQRQLELDAVKKRKQKEEEEGRKKKEEAKERVRREELEEEKRRLRQAESSDAQEAKRKAEELRWREMEERQRPFSFKVSSGEKQILFQKVNLSPVTPAAGHQGGAVAEPQRDGAARASSSSDGPDSPNLPTSPYVPHTAILVTGAQLCGTAVDLDQIKDTACKSLLGLGEDRKVPGTPTKTKTSPERKSGKTKSLNEASLSSGDQSGAAVLAEWASIRSKIFKGVEDGKYDEYPDQGRSQAPPGGEEPPAFAHTNLRKTMSASAKFSITPAKKKFADSNRNSEVFGGDEVEEREEAPRSDSPSGATSSPGSRPQSRTGKTVRIAERGSEECMFAKDLPSFLVPRPEALELKGRAYSESAAGDGSESGEDRGALAEDQPSPFGIKLRRTNFSLRFHSEQSAEKRKKRYSAGDSFDGVPSPLTPMEPGDGDASSVFSDRSSPVSPQNEGAVGKYTHVAAASPAATRSKAATKPSSPEIEKSPHKPSPYRRPAASPKLGGTGARPTPPPSPLPKVAPGSPGDRTGAAESSSTHHYHHQAGHGSEEPSAAGQALAQAEEEPKEKRSFFPSINIPWREKADRKTELMRRGGSGCCVGPLEKLKSFRQEF